MERLVKGSVVVVPFPFSDLSYSKNRPALVLAELKGDGSILCQITSKATSDEYSIQLRQGDFMDGKLNVDSNIRPNKLFTADRSTIKYKAGTISQAKIKEAIEKACQIIQG